MWSGLVSSAVHLYCCVCRSKQYRRLQLSPLGACELPTLPRASCCIVSNGVEPTIIKKRSASAPPPPTPAPAPRPTFPPHLVTGAPLMFSGFLLKSNFAPQSRCEVAKVRDVGADTGATGERPGHGARGALLSRGQGVHRRRSAHGSSPLHQGTGKNWKGSLACGWVGATLSACFARAGGGACCARSFRCRRSAVCRAPSCQKNISAWVVRSLVELRPCVNPRSAGWVLERSSSSEVGRCL